MKYTEPIFRQFLKAINLSYYREKYSKIKIVEMDLPRNIQALDTLYQIYWNKNTEQDSILVNHYHLNNITIFFNKNKESI